jgi:hypothetical protein
MHPCVQRYELVFIHACIHMSKYIVMACGRAQAIFRGSPFPRDQEHDYTAEKKILSSASGYIEFMATLHKII